MATLNLVKPAAHTQSELSINDQITDYTFDFNLSEAVLEKIDGNLVITFDADGSSIVLEDFYAVYNAEFIPNFVLDGELVLGEDFFNAMDPDLMPAAGPGEGELNQDTNGVYSTGKGILADGTNALGGKDGGSSYNADPTVLVGGGTVGTGGSGGNTSPANIAPTLSFGNNKFVSSTITTYDNPNADSNTGRTETGSFTFTPGNGFTDLTINGESIFNKDGDFMPGTEIETPLGKLTVDSYDVETGEVTYTYEQNNAQEHPTDENLNDEIKVEVKDQDGDIVTGTITVEIVDDAPVAEIDTDTVSEGEIIDGNILNNDYASADGGASAGKELVAVKLPESMIEAGWTQSGSLAEGTLEFTHANKGTITFNKDGSYKFDYTDESLGEGVKESFTFEYTIKDSDGDSSSAKLEIEATGTNDMHTVLDVNLGKVVEAGVQENADKAGFDANEAFAGTPEITGTLDVKALVTDADSADTFAFEAITKGESQYGSFTIDAKGNYTYTINQDKIQSLDKGDTVTDTITIQVKDQNGNLVETTVSVEVTGTNDAPTIQISDDDKALDAYEDGKAATGTAKGFDDDADHADLTFSLNQPEDGEKSNLVTSLESEYGTFEIDPTSGVYTFTPNAKAQELGHEETSDVSFDVYVRDEHGAYAKESVKVTITGSNDDAVINFTDLLETSDTGLIGSVTADGTNDLIFDNEDADTGSFNFKDVDGMENGSVVISLGTGKATIEFDEDGNPIITDSTVEGRHGNFRIMDVETDDNGGYNVTYEYVQDTAFNHKIDRLDSFDVTITDAHGKETTGTITTTIKDASADTEHDYNSMTDDGAPISGNLLDNDNGGADGFAASAQGVDGNGDNAAFVNWVNPKVTILSDPNEHGTFQSSETAAWTRVDNGFSKGGSITLTHPDYGTVVIHQDGTYTFDYRGANLTNGEVMRFDIQYTIRDADGNVPSAFLRVTVGDLTPEITFGNDPDATGNIHTSYDDADDVRNTDDSADARVESGNFEVTAGSGETTITLKGTDAEGKETTLEIILDEAGNASFPDGTTLQGEHGTLSNITYKDGTVSYTYTQDDSRQHGDENDGDTDTLGDKFDITVTDADGDSVSGSIDVTITDDAPEVSDSSSIAVEGDVAAAQTIITLDFGADLTDGATIELNGVTATWNGSEWTGAGASVDSDGTTTLTFGDVTLKNAASVDGVANDNWGITIPKSEDGKPQNIVITDADGDTKDVSITGEWGTTAPTEDKLEGLAEGTTGAIIPGQDYNISIIFDTSGSMVGQGTTYMNQEVQDAFEGFLNDVLVNHAGTSPTDGAINLQIVPFNHNAGSFVFTLENGTVVHDGKVIFPANGVASASDAIIKELDGFTEDNGDKLDAYGGTNYDTALQNSAEWLEMQPTSKTEEGVVSTVENKVFFITDGQPTGESYDTIVDTPTAVRVNENATTAVFDDVRGDIYADKGEESEYNIAFDIAGKEPGDTWVSTGTFLAYSSTGDLNDSFETESRYELTLTTDAYGNTVLEARPLVAKELMDMALGEDGEFIAVGFGRYVNEANIEKHFSDFADAIKHTNDPKELFTPIQGSATGSAMGTNLANTGLGNDVVVGGMTLDMIKAAIITESGLPNFSLSDAEAVKYIKEHPAWFEGLNSSVDDSKDADVIVSGAGADLVFGQGGDDLLIGDGRIDGTDDLAGVDNLAEALGLDEELYTLEALEDIKDTNSDGNTSDEALERMQDLVDAAHNDIETLQEIADEMEADNDANDALFGGDGDDIILGLGGNDFIYGGEGSDIILGGSGNDIIFGGEGSDTIFAGTGSDTIYGGTGDNTIYLDRTNEAGTERTVTFADGSEFTGNIDDIISFDVNNSGSETIHDFDAEHDLLDLTAFNSNDYNISAEGDTITISAKGEDGTIGDAVQTITLVGASEEGIDLQAQIDSMGTDDSFIKI